MRLNKKFKLPLLCAFFSVALLLCMANKDDAMSESFITEERDGSFETVVQNVTAYGLFIDSNEICVLESEYDAKHLADELFLKARRFYGMGEGCTYLNNVEINQGLYARENVNDIAEASKALGLDTVMGEPFVKTRDGKEILISICGVSLEQKYVNIDFETEYRFTYGVDTGYEKVLCEGKKGVIKQVYETETVNGNVIFDKMIVDYTVAEPITRIVEIGVTPSMQLLNSEMAFFIKPYDGIITSDYGYRYLGGYEFHTGIDLAAGNRSCYGDAVVAAADGVVVEAGYTSGKGNYIVIEHEFGFSTLYAHFKDTLVCVGDTVSAGDIVGTIGVSGRVTGAHLHFEIRVNGDHTDPEEYLKFE